MKRFLFAAVSLLLLCIPPMAAATIGGTVRFATRRGQNPIPAETLIWLESSPGIRAPRRAAATFQMMTRGKSLVPHILAIPAGSTVEFPNDDPISHNLFSLSSSNGFDLGLYRRGAGKAHRFETPGVVNVYCNVHPSMSAVIHVLSTPYYQMAGSDGTFRFDDLPSGRYRVVAWNEVGFTEVNTEAAAAPAPVMLTIDSRNFRAQAHLNKEGKVYQAPRSRDY